jgi:hypothetical protein
MAVSMKMMSDDGGGMHLWNVGLLQRDYRAQCPKRLSSSMMNTSESSCEDEESNFEAEFEVILNILLCIS